ncbi:MAG TPA: serine/threonine-protein kinase, partial [Thermoanaerobaculia bacterium]|nr:serine/threonine-protein kinase [Thermoanaerobaculia bacterium]
MNAVRWHEVDRVFAAVLERPPAERPEALDAACAGDSELQREVEQLLAADERIGSFLELPAAELLGLVPPGGEGGRAGPYRLLRRLGSGGMGTVYLARRDDEQYERLVAVKVLRWGLDTPEARLQFLAERQILARLEHPNIARLYDGGTTAEGQPYLVMELVEGLPVDGFCDLQRLSVERRLQLFRRICAAVQYAHQNLLVHRDLKPANILVTAEGEPKLLDFGIAKRLEKEDRDGGDWSAGGEAGSGAEHDGVHTLAGLRIMTPLYASPEQVQGNAITTASDVYSLGVLLYELLTGRPPFRGATLLETLQQVKTAEPVPPSRLVPGLPRDVETIALKCLQKDPVKRYDSAAELAEDLRRFLNGESIRARRS